MTGTIFTRIHVSRGLAVMALTLVPLGSALAQPDPYPSIWNCDSTKFTWYCDEEEENKPVPAPAPKPPPKPKTIKEMTSTKEIEAEMQRLLDLAVMSPTTENIKTYALALEYVKDKAGVFSDAWRRLAWQTPELNYVDRRPANAVGIDTYNTVRTAKKNHAIAELAKDHGIFFFFRSDCPYCHKLAPMLKQFQAQHGMEILPVSLDGKGLPDFPRFEANRVASKAFNVDRVPALLLISKSTGKVQPISFGMISLMEIEERIYTLTQTRPGDDL
jgi:conjugal transfer pilus assembly protein TraF